MVSIDAAKESYTERVELSPKLLRQGMLIAAGAAMFLLGTRRGMAARGWP
jgi:hypothetical protein